MSQTLINGTAYEIEKGNTMVNSTQYTIDHGNTLVGGTQYKIEFAAGPSFEWPGWDNATWEDINNLCYAKQQGYIDSWPSDVVLGGTRSETLSSAVLGTTTHDVMIIGMDQDADGTLTFQTQGVLANSAQYMSSNGAEARWSRSMAEGFCDSYYNYFTGKSYIKPVRKGNFDEAISRVASRNPTFTYTNMFVWIPSCYEISLVTDYTIQDEQYATTTNSESTYGKLIRYQYYTDNSSRVKGQQYWTRTPEYDNTNWVNTVSTSGGYRGTNASSSAYYAPAFVIGNPDAQTIE